jgi:hypothetical protein
MPDVYGILEKVGRDGDVIVSNNILIFILIVI